MNACKPLKEYAWSVYTVRNFRKAKINLDMAVDKMIDEMPDDFLIKEFMLENRAEVKMSFLREYDIEKDLQLLREELYEKGYDKGYDDARVEVIKETHNEIAVEMLKNGESLDKVSKYCGISEEETKKLAESLNVDK
jgi:hypothetical protein